MISKLIINGKLLENGKLVEKNILIENHYIRDIIEDKVTVDEIIDAKGNIILPGLIDSHVHFKGDFSESLAAAAGGITTILDMPDTSATTIELLNQKRELAKKSIVNYGFHFGSTKDNLGEIKNAENIASVKVDIGLDNSILENIFKESKMIIVNMSEIAPLYTPSFSSEKEGRFLSMLKNTPRPLGRVVFDTKQIQKTLDLFNKTKDKKKKLYFYNVSMKDELKMIRREKTKHIFAETRPRYLFLQKEDQDILWVALRKSHIDTIATDHLPEEKGSGNSGFPGCETMLPLLLDAYNKNKISLEKIQELCCENPAKIFSLRQKGKISLGYDADLVIIDINKEKEIKNEELFTKCKWSPFNGKVLKGWPVMTIVRGNIVFDDGRINDIKAKEVKYEDRTTETPYITVEEIKEEVEENEQDSKSIG